MTEDASNAEGGDPREAARYPYDESHFLDLYGKEGWEKRNLG